VESGYRMVWSKKKREKAAGAVLPGLLREKGWEKQLDLHSIFPRWRELVDAEVGDHAEPLKIVKGTLWLEVENSAWLQQLQYRKFELLDILNEALRLSRLTDIKLVLPVGRKKGKRKADRTISFVRPDEKKIAAFERQVSCIEDEQCRDALMQFWYLSHACRIEHGSGKSSDENL